jgi:hypothetical protein
MDGERQEIAHKGVRSDNDNDVETREPRHVSH